jgi:hypothetical protein
MKVLLLVLCGLASAIGGAMLAAYFWLAAIQNSSMSRSGGLNGDSYSFAANAFYWSAWVALALGLSGCAYLIWRARRIEAREFEH